MIALVAGVALGGAASFADNVPFLLGEIGKARADRSGWSQLAEFVSLLLDAGWAWAATAIGVGWLVSRGVRPRMGLLVGALGGFVALTTATIVFYGINSGVTGAFWWAQVLFWWVRSLVLGLPLGAVGAAIRRPGLAGILAALVAPVGAVLNVIVLPPPLDSRVAHAAMLTVYGGAVVATVLIVVRAVRARLHGSPAGDQAR